MIDRLHTLGTEKAKRPSSFFRSLSAVVIASLVLGLAAGAILRGLPAHDAVDSILDAFDSVGTMWVNAIRMTVIPLVVPLLIGSIAGASGGRLVGWLGLAGAGMMVAMLVVTAILTALTAPLLFAGLHVDPATTAHLRASVAGTALPSGDASPGSWFKGLIPANPIKAAADGSMLSIIVFAIAFGFAARGASAHLRARVVTFTETLTAIMLVMVKGVLLLAPLGVFAVALVVGTRLGVAAYGALSYFIGIELLAGAAMLLILLALTVGLGRLSPQRVLRGAVPPMLVGAGTSSSLSALPAMIEGARDEWALPEEIFGFVLPVAVSMFKLTAAFIWIIDASFIAALYGIPLGPGRLALAVGYTIAFSATAPGIPGGGIVAMAPMFQLLGLPLEGLAILLAVNPIVDRFLTMVNVAADMSVTSVFARWSRGSPDG
jgi:proton glutamate symport protein